MKKTDLYRYGAFGVVIVLIIIGFVQQLSIIQLAEGDYYKSLATKGSVAVRSIPAVRGEIVDRYGNPFTTNRVGYDVIVDRTFLPFGEENEILVELIAIMESMDNVWHDSLPISTTQPFEFTGTDAQVAKLKNDLGVGEYASAEECLYWLASPTFYDIAIYDDETDEKIGEYDALTMRKIAGIRYEMVQNAFSHQNIYVFASDVGEHTRDIIMTNAYRLPGVDMMESPVREYVDGTLAPHILGITGPLYKEDVDKLSEEGAMWSADNPTGYKNNEYIGKSGIEYTYEDVLRGTPGERIVTFDANGKVVEMEDTVAPIPGNTVVLTLDMQLQMVTQDALADTIAMFNADPTRTHESGKDADAGAVVVQLVETGEILAMANYPSYDISTYLEDYDELSQQTPEPLLNRATMGAYRPGSIFKSGVALAGLAEGLVTATETINCTHVYGRFPDVNFTCMYNHGPINVVTALQKSCNIYFYETGWRLGIDTMNDYMLQLGLGQKTGIEIPEAVGRLSSPEFTELLGGTWTPGNVVQSSIGQLDNMFTPVQISSYVSTIANKGERMQTHLVSAVKSYDFKDTIEETQPQVVETVDATAEAFETVHEGMVAATALGGTSYYQWMGFPYTVASKTGTPEGTTTLSSTYICYIPAEDPEIAITVVLENGGQGYTGAPIARLIAEEYFATKDEKELITPYSELLG